MSTQTGLTQLMEIADRIREMREIMGFSYEEMAEKSHCPLAETLRLMMPAQMRGGRVRVKTEKMAVLRVSPEEALEAAEREKRSPKRAALRPPQAQPSLHPLFP